MVKGVGAIKNKVAISLLNIKWGKLVLFNKKFWFLKKNKQNFVKNLYFNNFN